MAWLSAYPDRPSQRQVDGLQVARLRDLDQFADDFLHVGFTDRRQQDCPQFRDLPRMRIPRPAVPAPTNSPHSC